MMSSLRKGSPSSPGSFLALFSWSAVAVTSLAIILVAFIIGTWSWGLMDDYKFVALSGNYWDRISFFLRDTLANGKCCPVFVVHTTTFYKIFGQHPGLFYIFRWAEVAAALGIWGIFAAMITRRMVALPVLICVALSFYRLYDAFFILSTPEILGVFFSGCAGVSLYVAFGPAISRQGTVVWTQAILGLVWLWLAFGSREMFISAGVAWGVSLIISGLQKPRKPSLWISGLVLMMASLSYGILLKFLVSKGYTSAYTLTDSGKVVANIMTWARQDLVPHVPWLIAAVLFLFVRGAGLLSGVRVWAVSLGVALYLGYVLLLLPWQTVGYYSTPLGVFFAFLVTVLVADRMEKISRWGLTIAALAALLLNLYVGGSELLAAYTYQQDTASLFKWLASNVQFEYEIGTGAVVRTNAWEPGDTIPMGVNRVYGKSYQSFVFSPKVKDVLTDAKTRYYLYGISWGDQDLGRLGRIWYPVFMSKNWIMFRRLY